ncbi:MAG: type II toxin-antitoxin system RelE/ParE family toxin [Rhodocyclaceae bacterium]|nr:type II toxin-antitoxin system RelE/ParE family toxin [Rhodocyclaceae bacterium]
MKIRYLAVAHEEIREAADYYAMISPGLGKAFRRELRQLMRLVATLPLAWPPSGPGTRKCLLTRFPYPVIYAPLPGELLVLAVGHQHRRPGYWRERLDELE